MGKWVDWNLDEIKVRCTMVPPPTAIGDECWEYPRRYRNGYGRINTGGRYRLAHRMAYEFAKGAIPKGLDLDHLCRNRSCCNPAHLEPVTRRENLIRGNTIVARHAIKTHCPAGHEYTPENTRVSRGMRNCRTCHREQSAIRSALPHNREKARQRQREYTARKKAEKLAMEQSADHG